MSSIANLSSTQSAFPLGNIHAHGHKKGGHVDTADSSTSDTSAQIPVGTAQNVFGNLLRTLEQVVGVDLTTAPITASTGAGITANATTAAASATTAAASATTAAATTTAAAASTASAAATTAQSASALLQNYLNNLSQHSQADASPLLKLTGPNLRANA